MAVKGEVQIWDHENSQLEGPEENGSSRIVQFDFNAHQPYDPITKRIQGSVRIEEFQLTKEIDKLTPLLFNISTKGIICKKVVVTLYQINQESGGAEEPYFTYTLENARIAKIRNNMELILDKDLAALGHLEQLQMIADKITWEFIEGGVITTYPEEA